MNFIFENLTKMNSHASMQRGPTDGQPSSDEQQVQRVFTADEKTRSLGTKNTVRMLMFSWLFAFELTYRSVVPCINASNRPTILLISSAYDTAVLLLQNKISINIILVEVNFDQHPQKLILIRIRQS